MTAQIHNVFLYNDQRYSIIAQQNVLDFKPEAYGISPDTGCSMCWRGYYCKFGIIDNQLVIMDWNLMVKDTVDPPIVENTKAHISYGKLQYIAMNFPMDYSGGIVIGTGFIDKYYIHMGYQQVYAYEKVLELIFEKGQLMEAIDHSDRVEQIRLTIAEKHEGQKDQMLDNINNFFSLRYNEKWEGFK